MRTHLAIRSRAVRLLAVRAAEDLEFLVKEREILTGRAGRIFVIAGADRLTYHLRWHSLGFQVERLHEDGTRAHVQQLLRFEFLDHPLLEALHADQLFTTPISLHRRD
jgi:hypothetical protein